MFLQNNGNRIKCYQNAIKATYDTRKSQCLCGLPGLLLSSQKLLILPIKFSRILLRSFAEHYFSPFFTFFAFTCFGTTVRFLPQPVPLFFFFFSCSATQIRPALTGSNQVATPAFVNERQVRLPSASLTSHSAVIQLRVPSRRL